MHWIEYTNSTMPAPRPRNPSGAPGMAARKSMRRCAPSETRPRTRQSCRDGFVMANSAAVTRASKQDIRQKTIRARDVMIVTGSNFPFTVTLPCTLWFFNKEKCSSPVSAHAYKNWNSFSLQFYACPDKLNPYSSAVGKNRKNRSNGGNRPKRRSAGQLVDNEVNLPALGIRVTRYVALAFSQFANALK